MTTPKAQISTFSVYPAYLLTSSGAMYKGDPRIKFIPFYFSNFDAKPKSISFTFKFFMFSDVKSKFSNLKSLWAILRECKYFIAYKTYLTIIKVWISVKGCP